MTDQKALFEADESQEWVVQSVFAKKIGVSAEAVRKAIKNNRFDRNAIREERTSKGKIKYKINIIEGKRQWDENRGGVEYAPLTDQSQNDAKKREQTANANIAEFKFLEMDKQLVRVEAARLHYSKIAATIRDAFLNEPVTLAPAIVNIDDVNEVERILKEKFTEILKELSDAGKRGDLFK